MKNKTLEAVGLLLLLAVGSLVIGQLIFLFFVDTLIVPITGMRPVLSAVTYVLVFMVMFKFVDSKYQFEQKGGKLFKDFKIFGR